jgi:multidrug efflux pump subunit AcrA (membrane-fusion protein)
MSEILTQNNDDGIATESPVATPQAQEDTPKDDYQELKEAIRRERKRADELDKKLKGIDLTEYDRLRKLEEKSRSESEAARKRALEEQGKYQELLSEKDALLAAAKAEAAAAKIEAKEIALRSQLVAAFTSSGGIGTQIDNFLTLAKTRISFAEDGSVVYPGDAIKATGEPIATMAEYAVWLREEGGLGFAFEPLNKATGSNAADTRTAAAPTKPKSVSKDEAYLYLKEIAAGEITIKGV